MKTMRKQFLTIGGFTLLELMIVLAVMAVLVSWGFPSLQDSIRGNRIIAQNNEMIAILRYARSEAIRRNQDVEIHLNADGSEWQAYIEDPDHDADVDGCELGQLRCAENENVSMATSSNTIIFNNRGYIRDADDTWTSETLYLQHENCSGNLRRRIDIMPTGQINSCSLPCGSVDSCGS